MAIPLETLEAEVLKLSTGARSHLLNRLIASLETDAETEEAWALEAERRDVDVDGGKVRTVPGAELLDRLRADLR
jgi:hypothetical protein